MCSKYWSFREVKMRAKHLDVQKVFLLSRHSKIKYISLDVYNIFFLREVKLGTQFLDTRVIFLRSNHSKNYV